MRAVTDEADIPIASQPDPMKGILKDSSRFRKSMSELRPARHPLPQQQEISFFHAIRLNFSGRIHERQLSDIGELIE